jgi:hypothetical protein
MFLYSIYTRIPLHIASIQNGNLIPLQNGINNFDELSLKKFDETQSFLDRLCDYIQFGNFEKIMDKLENIIVISIMGKQSSGKKLFIESISRKSF